MQLFTPVNIAGLTLKNRLVMPSMGTVQADLNGAVTDRMIAYYAERARGGVGLIIVEGGFVTDERFVCRLGLHTDQMITGLNDLAQTIKDNGAAAAIQLIHNGRLLRRLLPFPGHHDERGPDFLTTDEIEQLVESFGLAALRAQEAGFDAVEISACHGYLVAQFLSPYTNHRKDRYGGTPENRVAFAVEVVARIRKYAGTKYPVIFRISGDEYVPQGLKIENSIWIAKRMEAEGVDAIHVTAGICKESFQWANPPMAFPQGCLVHLAEKVKKEVGIPVITVGRINDPAFAENILIEGKADLIAIGRALLADPEFPDKAAQGRFNEIRKCIYCNYCNGQRAFRRRRIRCAINAAAGRELDSALRPAEIKRKILVAGGGPGGMEAARVCALRGHKTILCERNGELGGRPNIGSKPPHKEEINNVRDYLSHQLVIHGVETRLNTPVTLDLVNQLRPDTVIMATGSLPIIPKIPGANFKNIFTADEVLGAGALPGKTHLIIGGGTVGCETAEYLAENGNEITIIEILSEIAADMERIGRGLLLERLFAKGVKTRTGSRVTLLKENSAIVEGVNGKEEIAVDCIIIAIGSRPDNELYRILKDVGYDVHLIGDAKEARSIAEAVSEGWQIARRV